MNLTDIASIAGAVSAVAVLISLLFLNLQVRQAEKNQRAMVQQGRAGRTADIAMRLMSSDFAEVYHHCMNAETEVSATQLAQFTGYCRAVFLGAEDSFLQNQESQLDELAFVSFTTALLAIFISPGVRTVWKMTRDWYGAEFAEFMDGIVRDATHHTYVDQLTQWKVILSADISKKEWNQSRAFALA